MSRKVSYIPRMVTKIEDILQLYAEYCPTGLACFFGAAPLPGTEELALMLSAKYCPAGGDVGRVNGGKDIPRQQIVVDQAREVEDVIEAVGGYDALRKVFALYDAEKPEKARILREMSFIGRSFKYPCAEEFAYKHHMSTRQFYRCKEYALRQISWEIYRRASLSWR